MRRETYSSLKAADGAWRVAMDYLYRRPIDVMTQRCGGCGRELDLGRVGDGGNVKCAACGWVGTVPGYVVAEAQRRRAERVAGDTSAYETWVRENPEVVRRVWTGRGWPPAWAVLVAGVAVGWTVLVSLWVIVTTS